MRAQNAPLKSAPNAPSSNGKTPLVPSDSRTASVANGTNQLTVEVKTAKPEQAPLARANSVGVQQPAIGIARVTPAPVHTAPAAVPQAPLPIQPFRVVTAPTAKAMDKKACDTAEGAKPKPVAMSAVPVCESTLAKPPLETAKFESGTIVVPTAATPPPLVTIEPGKSIPAEFVPVIPPTFGDNISVAKPGIKEKPADGSVKASPRAATKPLAAVTDAGRRIPSGAIQAAAPVQGGESTAGTSDHDQLARNVIIAGSAIGTVPVFAAAMEPHAAVFAVKAAAADHSASGAGLVAEAQESAGTSARVGDPRTLVATPNVLEVGIPGGSHGWLRVRAEMSKTGEVTASLVASNVGSAEALHKDLGSLSAYLQSESVGVSALTVMAPERGAGTQGAGTYSASEGSGAGAQTQSGRRELRSPAGDGDASTEPQAWEGLSTPFGFESGMVPSALLGGRASGGWLNVVA
jgi:hypothetical protein